MGTMTVEVRRHSCKPFFMAVARFLPQTPLFDTGFVSLSATFLFYVTIVERMSCLL